MLKPSVNSKIAVSSPPGGWARRCGREAPSSAWLRSSPLSGFCNFRRSRVRGSYRTENHGVPNTNSVRQLTESPQTLALMRIFRSCVSLSAVASAVEAICGDNCRYLVDVLELQMPAKQPFQAGYGVGNRLTRNEQVSGSSPLVGSPFLGRCAEK